MQSSFHRALSGIRRLKNEPLVLACIVFFLACAALFVVWPVVRVLSYPTARDFLSFFTTRTWYRAMLHSLFLTAISTVTCTAIAFVFAFAIVRCRVPCKPLFKFVTVLPVLSPPFIVALSYIFLFGGQGIITKGIFHLHVNIYGWQGLWFVQTITFFPYAYVVIDGVMRSVSASQEYAAANLGAGRWRVFRDVTLPLCRPGLAGGALMAALNVLTDFGNPVMVGGNYTVLPTEAYMQVVGWNNLPTASMLATMLLIPAVALFCLQKLWLGRRSYTTVTGKESNLPAPTPSAPARWAAFAFCAVFSLVVLAVYGILFYGAFTKLWGYDWSFSLKNFAYVLFAGQQLLNSVVFALVSSLCAALGGLVLAYLAQKKRTGLSRTLDFFALAPGAVPGIFLGLGFAIAFNGKPLVLTGTAAIMIIALTVWNIPNCYTASAAALGQIGDSIEEASLNLGGGSFRTFCRVIFPMLRVPFLSSFTVAFLRGVTCLSVIIFIYSINTVVGTISILNFVQGGLWGAAAALTVLLIAVALAVMGVIQLFIRRQRREPSGG